MAQTNLLPNPYYWAGNEPDVLAPWEFAWAGRSDLVQQWTRWVAANKYNTDASGVPGNSDYGELDAWLVFAMLGFYPLAGSTTYILGSPAFANVTLHLERVYEANPQSTTSNSLPQAGTLSIIAHGASPTAVYVSKLHVNGVPWSSPFIDHAVLASGSAVLEFWMSETAPDASSQV